MRGWQSVDVGAPVERDVDGPAREVPKRTSIDRGERIQTEPYRPVEFHPAQTESCGG